MSRHRSHARGSPGRSFYSTERSNCRSIRDNVSRKKKKKLPERRDPASERDVRLIDRSIRHGRRVAEVEVPETYYLSSGLIILRSSIRSPGAGRDTNAAPRGAKSNRGSVYRVTATTGTNTLTHFSRLSARPPLEIIHQCARRSREPAGLDPENGVGVGISVGRDRFPSAASPPPLHPSPPIFPRRRV